MIPLRRIGILGDIHAEDALLEEGIEFLLHLPLATHLPLR